MHDLAEIKIEIAKIAKLVLEMWRTTHEAFMEHEVDLISQVLDKEVELNNKEKEITKALVAVGRSLEKKSGRASVTAYADAVGDLELIGDYCKDILERVQIKIEEKLLFSEEAVKEYNTLYEKTEHTLEKVVEAIEKDDLSILGEILKDKGHIDNLVDEYRSRHNQRLIDGVCSPLACNMFLNMLDFTAAVYYHTKKIAKGLAKIK